MSDLLGSASLLVGVAGLIYSVWYPEIKAALELDVPTYGRDSRIQQVEAATRSKALPITVVVVALTAALVPPACSVAWESVRAIHRGRVDYDAVKACFLIVFGTLAVLSVACVRDLLRLVTLRRRLKEPVPPV